MLHPAEHPPRVSPDTFPLNRGWELVDAGSGRKWIIMGGERPEGAWGVHHPWQVNPWFYEKVHNPIYLEMQTSTTLEGGHTDPISIKIRPLNKVPIFQTQFAGTKFAREIPFIGFYPLFQKREHSFDSVYPKGLPTGTPDDPTAQFYTKCGFNSDFAALKSIPTDASVTNNFEIRRMPRIFEPKRPDLLEKALDIIVEWFPEGGFNVVELPFVDISKQGSSGVGFECCSNKERAYLNHYSAISWFTDNYRSAPEPIAKYMHKIEVLPIKKIIQDLTRPIIYTPATFYFLQKKHTQEMDDYMKTGQLPFVAYGINLYGGGMNGVAARMNRKLFKFKGDCEKFDSTVRRKLFHLIYKLRKRLMPLSSKDALNYIRDYLSDHPIVLPDGSVIRDLSQISGQACTTSDNCLGHLIVVVYMALVRLSEMGKKPTSRNVLELLDFSMYADDHVGATDDERLASYVFRKEIYAEFGVVLKESDDLVTTDITDLTFLGGRFHYLEGYNRYIYSYDSDPLASFWIEAKGRSDDQNLAALMSYAQLRPHDEEFFSKIKTAYNKLKEQPHLALSPALSHRNYYIRNSLGLE